MGCQKINSTEVEEKIKAGISINNCSEKNCSFQNLHRQYWSEAEIQLNTEHWNWKKGILKRTPPHLAYT